jgi:hypothetical protein
VADVVQVVDCHIAEVSGGSHQLPQQQHEC